MIALTRDDDDVARRASAGARARDRAAGARARRGADRGGRERPRGPRADPSWATSSARAASGCGRSSSRCSGLAFGAEPDDLAEIGAAAELVHTATLLHDDVIDRGETRRGLPTANVRFGDGPPVLSGDYLYARVFKRLLARRHHAAL